MCLEVCKFLKVQDLLLSVALVSKLWQVAGTHDEVWAPLCNFYFSETRFTDADSYLSKFKTHVFNTYLPVIHSGKLFKCYISGRTEIIDLTSRSQHTWWEHSVIWSIVLLPDFNIFICFPESSSVAMLDKDTGLELEELPCMTVERMYPGVCLCNQSVYVFGGSECDVGYFNPMNTCEKFDLVQKVWKKLPDMKQVYNGCTPAAHQAKIYIPCSGYLEVLDSHTDEFLSDIVQPSLLEESPAFCWQNCIAVGLRSQLLVLSQSNGVVSWKQKDTNSCPAYFNIAVSIESLFVVQISTERYGFHIIRILEDGEKLRETEMFSFVRDNVIQLRKRT